MMNKNKPTNNERFLTYYEEFENMLAISYPEYDQSKGAVYFYQNKICPADRRSYVDAIRKQYNALKSSPLNGSSGSMVVPTELIDMLLAQISYLFIQIPQLKELFIDSAASKALYHNIKR